MLLSVLSIIFNVLAVIIAPIISVLIAQKLQENEKKRQDKMDIFKTLMTSRIYGWTTQSVHSLNIIDIVFADDDAVRQQWKKYYDKLCVENPSETELRKIKIEQDKLLETIANSLGYKKKVSWETIQNPYIPKGMIDSMNQQQQNQNNQALIMEYMKNSMPKQSGGNNNEQNEIRDPESHE